MLTLNRSRTFIKCVVLGVLFTCVLFGLSSAPIFAASEDSPSSEVSSWLAPDLDSVQAKALAEQLSDRAVAVDYTTTDIYNLLYNAMRGEVYNSSYSLPKIASYTNRIAQILYGSGQSVPATSLYSRVNTINSNISDLFHAVVDGNSTNIPVGPGIRQMLYGIDSGGNWETLFDTSQDSRDLLQLIYAMSGQIHGDGQNNSSYLSSINQSISALPNGTIPWSSYGTFVGCSTGLNNSYLSGSSSGTTFYYTFSPSSYNNLPAIFYFDLPAYISADNYTIDTVNPQIDFYFTNASFSTKSLIRDIRVSSVLTDRRNIRVYVYNLPVRYTSYNFTIKVSTSTNQNFNSSLSSAFMALPSSSEFYYSVLDDYYLSQLGDMSDDVHTLTEYFANSSKAQAEEASSAVIDDTLDGFTGNGSAAAKTSDTGSMKNMSGSIQNGLNSGASASNAASVFSNQTFWSWFTQATSDGINNAYPAPVVQNTRGSGDYVPDFLSGNESELQDLLNQRNSW